MLLIALLLAGTLSADVAMHGRVVDEQSRPIAGARVGLFAAFLPEGERGGIATTDGDGAFTFAAHPRQKHLLWIEADGYAPRLLDGIAANAPEAIATIRLARGASLSVTLTDPATSRLQLVPRQVALGENVTPELARAMWTRDAAARVEWPSLSPGEYELLHLGDAPRSLLVVTLGAGDRKVHALSLATPGRDATVTLEGDPLARPIVTRWMDGKREEIVVRIEGNTVVVPGGCVDGASYVIAGGDRFASVRFDPSCSARTSIHSRAAIRTQLRWTRKRAPTHGMLVARDCDVEVPFTIDAQGVADLIAPANCKSLALSVPGFAPIDLRPNVAAYELQEAASLLVRAVSREDGLPLDGATVLAFAASDLNTVRLDELTAARAKARAVVNRDGWARLIVAAGDVIVGVVRGRVPWLSEKYRVETGRETIADLEVPRPGSVNLRVALAPELQESGVRVVQVFLQPASGERWPPHALFHGQMQEGLARFEDVPPGRWIASTMIRMLDDPPMRGDSIEVEVRDGLATDATLDVKGLLFRGRIIDDGAKIGRSMLLNPNERGREVTTAIDNNRRFVALLEKRGLYAVHFLVDDNETVVPDVEFDDPAKEVEIRLPHGSISGRVIDANDKPVAGAVVRATMLHQSGPVAPVQLDVTARSASDGSFRFARAVRGRWMVSAKAKSGESERVPIDLREGEAVGSVVLRVDDVRTATVRVIYDNGVPAAGAKVSISAPPAAIGDYGAADLVMTDAQGRFRFRETAAFRDQPLRFAITTADGTVASFRRPLSDGLTLTVPTITGQLTVTMERGQWPPSPLHTWLVAEDGSIVGSRFGRVVVGSDGRSRFVIARLAPGIWRLIVPATLLDIHHVLSGNSAAVPALGSARVPPGGSAEMVIDPENGGG